MPSRLFPSVAALLLIAASCAFAPPAWARTVPPHEQVEVLHAAADLIEARYVDAGKARTIAEALRRSDARWNTALEAPAFARRATEFMREASGDGHLGLSYSEQVLPASGGDEAFSAEEMQRWYGAALNHGIERIERLPGNVMLMDLRVFPPPDMAGDVFAAAMTVVAQGEALILDLRNNGGGAETSQLLAGYLLPPGSPLSGMYDRPSDTRTWISSPAWVPGRRFGPDKPVYVLTSRRTFSAAEAVAYDLQALRRAVIVGEVTGGGAHPFAYRRIAPHFAVDLPESRSINPVTGGNWQDSGVQPDVEVPAAEALSEALRLIRAARAPDAGDAG